MAVIDRTTAGRGGVATDQRAMVRRHTHRSYRSSRLVSVVYLQRLDLSATQGGQEGHQEPRQARSVN